MEECANKTEEWFEINDDISVANTQKPFDADKVKNRPFDCFRKKMP